MRIVALLPMKGNSERVPGKNFKPLGHKPLFRWMLDTLIEIDQIEEVIINTDAEAELVGAGLDVNAPAFAKVRFRQRKESLLGDFTSMNLIIQDDIDAVPADCYLMTHVTNPFISAETVQRAIEAFQNDPDKDSLFAVNRFQTRFYEEDGTPVNHDPNNLIRTQDLTPWYEENSCLYLFTAESFAATQARIGNKPILFETPRLESVDIDEPEDWDLAATLSQSLFANKT